MGTHRFSGQVVDSVTHTGIEALLIEARVVGRSIPGAIAAAVTDSHGKFSVELSDTNLRDLFKSDPRPLFFRVIESGTDVVASTERTLKWLPLRDGTGVIEVTAGTVLGTVPATTNYSVEGYVTNRGGTPQDTMTVKLYYRQFATAGVEEELIATTTTSSLGAYRFAYDAGALDDPGRVAPDLVVKAFNAEPVPAVVGTATLCNAPPRAVIDVVIGGVDGVRHPRLNRYADVSARVERFTGPVDVNPRDLSDAQIDNLVCRTGLGQEEIRALRSAYQLEELHPTVVPEVFFGLVRRGLPTTADELFNHRMPALQTALESAAAGGTISPDAIADLPAVMAALEAEAILNLRVTDPAPGVKLRLGNLLDSAPDVTPTEANAFLNRVLNSTASADDFWAAIATDGAFTPDARLGLRFSAEAAFATGFFQPVVTVLQARVVASTLSGDADSLATLSETEWRALIDALPTAPRYPADTEGVDDNAKRATYAKALVRNVEARFRTSFIRERVKEAEPTSTLTTFFIDNAAFDFTKHRLDRHLAENPTALDSVPSGDRPALVARIKGIERVFRVTKQWHETDAIVAAGYNSAHEIHSAGKDVFAVDMASAVSTERVDEIYDAACWASTAATALKVKYAPEKMVAQGTPDWKQSTITLPNAIADWATLFGSPDSCSCEHCRSVLGAAAYLADTLQLLRRVPRSGGGTAREALHARRPDIQRIALSCKNTDTALPYVDLVNEIMEVRTATPTWPSLPVLIDTGLTSAELAAEPEILFPTERAAAYTTLEAAVFPMGLPFHLGQEEARIYLAHMGVRRADLLVALAPVATGPVPRELTLERLETSGNMLDIVTGPPASPTPPTPPQPYHYWGISLAAWPADLSKVSVFLEKSALSYDQLRELFATAYCTTNTIKFDDDATCDLETMLIDGLTDDTKRHFLHRLLRLKKVLGWSITDTDKAHTALGSFSSAAITQLADIRELERRLKVPPVELLAWHADVDRTNNWAPSLFERVFLDKRVAAPDNATFALVFSTGTSAASLTSVRAGLLAALGLSQNELSLLIDAAVAGSELALPPVHAGAEIANLARLSRLYRVVRFTRAVGLSMRDWLVIRQLSGANALLGDDDIAPIEPATPSGAVGFLDTLARFAACSLSLAEIHYLTRHVVRPEDNLEPLDEEIDAWISEIDEAVRAAAEEARDLVDPDGELLKALAVRFVGPIPGADYFDVVRLAENDLTDVTTPTATAFITDTLAPLLGGTSASLSDALAKLATGGGTLTEIEDRRNYLARSLQRYAAGAGVFTSWVSQTFGLELEVAGLLVDGSNRTNGAVFILGHANGPVMNAFLPGTIAEWGDARGLLIDRKNLLKRIQKAALVLRRGAFSAEEVVALYPAAWAESLTADALPALNFNLLPITRAATGTALEEHRTDVEMLLRMMEVAALRDRWPGGRESLFALFALAGTSPTLATVLDATSAGSGWERTDLEAVVVSLGVNDVLKFKEARSLLRVENAVAAVRRLGVRADVAIGWADVEASLTDSYVLAREMREAARARHTESSWNAVARPLRNALRERQRNALSGYLVNLLALKDTNALYEHLLVDVEMDPCMLTSRLVLAHGSVQLFTHRILFNLESDVPPTTLLGQEWRWMKNYRVWEANRKVFLWPENWIEPELRGDKTPLFEDLETALLSGPLDPLSIENAYRSYLDGLADVAHLDIIALHSEIRDNPDIASSAPKKVVHVFGRTLKSPQYFHRKREDGQWTPWRKIDLDIAGDHLMPFTFGGRLYLSWAELEDKELKLPMPEGPDASAAESVIADKIEELKTAFIDGDFVKAAALAAEIKSIKELGLPFSTQPAAPTPMQLTVKLGVSELRGDLWTAPTYSQELELGASPPRVLLSFLTDVDDGSVTTTMLAYFVNGFSNYFVETARFIYSPGTATYRAVSIATLSDTRGVYPIGLLDWVATPSNPVTVTAPGILPGGIPPHDQRFSAAGNAWLRLFLYEQGSPNPAAMVLQSIKTRPRVLVFDRRQAEPIGERGELVLWEDDRSFFAELRYKKNDAAPNSLDMLSISNLPDTDDKREYRFEPFSHRFVNSFRHALAAHGLDGLLRPADQASLLQDKFVELEPSYNPTGNSSDPFPDDIVDFTLGSTYGVYNYELFFHAPLLIATRLGADGRFEDAMRWFHFIFDPTDGKVGADASRYWKFRPFRELEDLSTIQEDLGGLAESTYAQEILGLSNQEAGTKNSDEIVDQIEAWRQDPFDPHLLARMRPIAYMKCVVMKYVDNLIAWADHLFTQDTRESVNEATQLYIIAYNILGRRPVLVSDPHPVDVQSYKQLDDESAFDAFSNAIVGTETFVPKPPHYSSARCSRVQPPPTIAWGSLYFCIPPNEKLLGYWDTVADRLFKIRNCQNIEGVVRALPLFEPPIDPALLVRAAAAGLDLSNVLFDLNVAAPPYRYSVLQAKALELASSVASLGQSYLSALEKQDGEELSNMRQRHEVATQKLILIVRKGQVDEAEENLRATERSLKLAEERLEFYSTRDRVNDAEKLSLDLAEAGMRATALSGDIHMAASYASYVPDFVTGVSGAAGSPVSTAQLGGTLAAKGLQMEADALQNRASLLTAGSEVVGTQASYGRRKDDWNLQSRLAQKEISQIEAQIEAGRIRVEVAKHELAVVEKQIAQSKEVEDFLKRKFTNQQLYGWMTTQLGQLYYQAYKLAFEVAKRAQRAFQYERGDDGQTFITFGYWQGGKKGLLAGERLLHDLRRMDAAYVAQNKRELELTKMVSLAEHHPAQLVLLRDSGVAEFSLTEDDYDRDFADHYMRRIKTLAVSVPCVPGPYQGVLGTLTVLQGATRAKRDEDTLTPSHAALQSIVTSQAQQDAGLFELQFRDERLLPFEGVGAHLPDEPAGEQIKFALSKGNRFDYRSIDDLVLDIRYTARAGRTEEVPVANVVRPVHRLVRIRDEVDAGWAAFKEATSSSFILTLPQATWRRARNEGLEKVTKVTVHAWFTSLPATIPTATLTPPAGAAVTGAATGTRVDWLWESDIVFSTMPTDWTLAFTTPTTEMRAALDDLWIIFDYEVKTSS